MPSAMYSSCGRRPRPDRRRGRAGTAAHQADPGPRFGFRLELVAPPAMQLRHALLADRVEAGQGLLGGGDSVVVELEMRASAAFQAWADVSRTMTCRRMPKDGWALRRGSRLGHGDLLGNGRRRPPRSDRGRHAWPRRRCRRRASRRNRAATATWSSGSRSLPFSIRRWSRLGHLLALQQAAPGWSGVRRSPHSARSGRGKPRRP